MTPGPPLNAGEEFCECEPPSRWECVKALAGGLGATLLSVAAQVGIAVATGRAWGVAAACAGGFIGYLVHLSAGRHRSKAVGIIAAGGAILAAIATCGVLVLPFADPSALMHTSVWLFGGLTVVGGYLAYRLAGPTGKEEPL